MSQRPRRTASRKEPEPAPAPTKKVKTEAVNNNFEALQDIAHRLRIKAVEMTNASNSGHPTTCASMAEILSVLFFDENGMHYDAKDPKGSFTSDRFVLSKGHAAPILYAAWSENGFIPKEELLNLRKIDSDLEGHPTPILPFVDVATGSLGQGLGCASGMAYASKYLDKLDNHYWVVMGDGESAEGSVWEAANFAGHYELSNLTCIVDVNRLGQSQETILGHETGVYKKRFDAFGWNSIVIDGHNIADIVKAFKKARESAEKPTAIIARTLKGKYFTGIEDELDWHGKPIPGDKLQDIIKGVQDLIKNPDTTLVPTPPAITEWKQDEVGLFELKDLPYHKGQKFSTRKAYGEALKRLGQNSGAVSQKLVSLDADTKNSTFSLTFKNAFPDQFIECFIAEQNMVSVAQGVACRRKVPFAATFACFLTRAFDQIRMGGISRTNIVLAGSHCGVSIGEDGPSQMALEDLAMMRALPQSIVFYPSDAVSAERAVELAANADGIRYIRTSRPESPVLYDNNEEFKVGQSKTVLQSESDRVLVVSAGVILHEALKAAESLKGQGVAVRVVDLFTVKPIDKEGLTKAARESGNTIITFEEHYIWGGIHDAVSGALAEEKDIRIFGVGVEKVPHSGKPEELLDLFNLSAAKIEQKIKSVLEISA